MPKQNGLYQPRHEPSLDRVVPQPAFRQSVPIVVKLCSFEQVTDSRKNGTTDFVGSYIVISDTGRVIANVPDDVLRCEGFPRTQFPCSAVRDLRGAPPCTDASIAVGDCCPDPYPASVADLNLFPKPLTQRTMGGRGLLANLGTSGATELSYTGVSSAVVSKHELGVAQLAMTQNPTPAALGKVFLHPEPPTRGATPPAVLSSAEALLRQFYHAGAQR